MEFNEDNFKALQTENAGLKEKITAANNEAKGHRLSAEAYRTEAADFRGKWQTATSEIENVRTAHAADLDKVKIDYTAQLTAAQSERDAAKTSASQRLVDADLRFAAREAGMHDLDGLKLLDRAGLKVDDDGNVTNAAEILASMKEAKPYLFGNGQEPGTSTGTTTSTNKTPTKTPETFNAMTASPEDYKKAKDAYVAQNR